MYENMRQNINKGENASDWAKRYNYGLGEKIEVIEQLINEL
jgi:hypothetical protein